MSDNRDMARPGLTPGTLAVCYAMFTAYLGGGSALQVGAVLAGTHLTLVGLEWVGVSLFWSIFGAWLFLALSVRGLFRLLHAVRIGYKEEAEELGMPAWAASISSLVIQGTAMFLSGWGLYAVGWLDFL